jgi:hypothetical protein
MNNLLCHLNKDGDENRIGVKRKTMGADGASQIWQFLTRPSDFCCPSPTLKVSILFPIFDLSAPNPI